MIRNESIMAARGTSEARKAGAPVLLCRNEEVSFVVAFVLHFLKRLSAF